MEKYVEMLITHNADHIKLRKGFYPDLVFSPATVGISDIRIVSLLTALKESIGLSKNPKLDSHSPTFWECYWLPVP